MTGDDPYNEVVSRYFENPVHAGTLDGNYDEAFVSDASESGNAVRVVLCAGLKDGKIASLRFRAKGCPHLVALPLLLCRLSNWLSGTTSLLVVMLSTPSRGGGGGGPSLR